MFRTQIYLTEFEKESLNHLSQKLGTNQSALIREAIDQFIEKEATKKNSKITLLQEVAGIWSGRTDLPDFNEIREEMDRNYDE